MNSPKSYNGKIFLNPFFLPNETTILFVLFIIGFVTFIVFFLQFLTKIVLEYVSYDILILCLLFAMLISCIVVYLMYPSVIIKRNNLRILDKKSYAQLYKFIEELKKDFKTIKNSEITLFANIVPYDVNGFIFGTKRKIYISMTLGLLKLYKSNSDFFKIIIKHELSHAENNDIYKTYLIETLWKILLLVFSIIFIIILFQNIDYKTTITISVISIFYIIVLFLVKNSFLKQREFFADVRAINDIKQMDIFLTIINKFDKKLFHNDYKGGFTGSWYHPKNEKRVEVVRNPNILFELNKLSGFCIGFYIGLSFFTMQIIGSYAFVLIFFITIPFIGYLISLKMVQNKLLSKTGNAKKRFELVKYAMYIMAGLAVSYFLSAPLIHIDRSITKEEFDLLVECFTLFMTYMTQGVVVIILVFGDWSDLSTSLLNFYKLKKRKEATLICSTLLNAFLIYIICATSVLVSVFHLDKEYSFLTLFFAICFLILAIIGTIYALFYAFFSLFYFRCPDCNRRISRGINIFEFNIFEECLNDSCKRKHLNIDIIQYQH